MSQNELPKLPLYTKPQNGGYHDKNKLFCRKDTLMYFFLSFCFRFRWVDNTTKRWYFFAFLWMLTTLLAAVIFAQFANINKNIVRLICISIVSLALVRDVYLFVDKNATKIAKIKWVVRTIYFLITISLAVMAYEEINFLTGLNPQNFYFVNSIFLLIFAALLVLPFLFLFLTLLSTIVDYVPFLIKFSLRLIACAYFKIRSYFNAEFKQRLIELKDVWKKNITKHERKTNKISNLKINDQDSKWIRNVKNLLLGGFVFHHVISCLCRLIIAGFLISTIEYYATSYNLKAVIYNIEFSDNLKKDCPVVTPKNPNFKLTKDTKIRVFGQKDQAYIVKPFSSVDQKTKLPITDYIFDIATCVNK